MGMVGLYVGRIYDEARGRPLYIVREKQGFGDTGGEVIWQPSEAQAHNVHDSTVLRP
jgi:hypothetical protein